MDFEKLKEISFQSRESCMVCGEKIGRPIVSMPSFPVTEIYTKKRLDPLLGFVDQEFHFCSRCGQGQLANVIDVDFQYEDSSSYFFRTSESATAKTSSDIFLSFFNRVVGTQTFKHIVELGCNDLYVLKALEDRAQKLTGIDPILKGQDKEVGSDKIAAIGDFFENVHSLEDFDLVICKDTLEHVSEPKAFVEKIVKRANPETTFFFQFPLFEELLSGCRFDQVFHQHVNYFSLKSVLYMLDELDCELVDYDVNHYHWGAVMIAFRKKSKKGCAAGSVWDITKEEVLNRCAIFKKNMETTNDRLLSLSGERIYGYGAALMLPVLGYYLGNDFSSFECIVDDNPKKDGLFYINLPVAVKNASALKDVQDAIVFITAVSSMNNIRAILPKLFELKPKQILLPLGSI